MSSHERIIIHYIYIYNRTKPPAQQVCEKKPTTQHIIAPSPEHINETKSLFWWCVKMDTYLGLRSQFGGYLWNGDSYVRVDGLPAGMKVDLIMVAYQIDFFFLPFLWLFMFSYNGLVKGTTLRHHIISKDWYSSFIHLWHWVYNVKNSFFLLSLLCFLLLSVLWCHYV